MIFLNNYGYICQNEGAVVPYTTKRMVKVFWGMGTGDVSKIYVKKRDSLSYTYIMVSRKKDTLYVIQSFT